MLYRLGVILGVLLVAIGPGWAQTPPRTPQEQIEASPAEPGPRDTVTSRERPEYEPLGIRLGGFFLYPEAELTEIYRDNIYYRSDDEESDLISVFSPSALLRSNWNNHALNLFADMDVGRYLDNTGEDFVDWRTGFDGRVDIDRSTNMTGGFVFAHEHEGRSSPDQTGAAEPVEYDRYGPNAGITKRFNRLSIGAGGEVNFLDYSDARANNGSDLDQDVRDRRESRANVRVGYELVPDRYEGFVRGTVNQRTYDDSPDGNGFDRDSDGWEVVGGVAVDLGDVTYGNIFAGYLRQSFDDPTLDAIEGPGFGGDLTWNPTRLTTVTAAAQRTVEETTLSGASGALASQFRVGVDHELLRNVILSADAQYETRDYEGIGREDDMVTVGGGAEYLINRHFSLQFRYSYDTRDSSVAGADYDANTVFVRLGAQY